MPKSTLSDLFQKPFDLLEELAADGSPPRSVYSTVRTRDEGVYTQTNTQPGTGLHAPDDDSEWKKPAAETDQETAQDDAFDCPDPVTCDTCNPRTTTGD